MGGEKKNGEERCGWGRDESLLVRACVNSRSSVVLARVFEGDHSRSAKFFVNSRIIFVNLVFFDIRRWEEVITLI